MLLGKKTANVMVWVRKVEGRRSRSNNSKQIDPRRHALTLMIAKIGELRSLKEQDWPACGELSRSLQIEFRENPKISQAEKLSLCKLKLKSQKK